MTRAIPKIAPVARTDTAPEPTPPRTLGQIFTFYSFKGGVGRSMALANIAVLAAGEGKRILVVDWDLEAPGLEHYFLPHDEKLRAKLEKTPGVIDMLTPAEPAEDTSTAAEGTEASPADPAPFTSWRDCVATVRLGRVELDILHSGKMSRDDATYTAQVQGLDWPALYDRWDIGGRFDRIRSEWIEEYDLVFLDSRTGVTDIGDLCTVILPDHLVLLFITNRQNLDGIASIYERAGAAQAQLPRDRLKLTALPLLSRDEFYSEYDLSTNWRNIAAEELGHIYADWLPPNVKPQEAIQKLFIPYFAIWSFGEALPVVSKPDAIHNPASINAAFSRITQLILHDLDWSALASVADPGEAAQSQAAREADLERRRRELEEGTAARERELASRQRRSRARTWVAAVIVVLGLAAVGGWYLYSVTDAAREIVQVRRDLEEARSELAVAQRDIAVRDEQIAESRRWRAAAAEELAVAQTQRDELRAALNTREKLISAQQAEIDGYAKRLEALDAAERTLADLRSRLEASEAVSAASRATLTEVRAAMAAAEARAKRAVAERDAAQAAANRAEAELAASEKTMDKLRDDAERAIEQAQQLADRLPQYLNLISSLQRKEVEYSARIAELEADVKEKVRDAACERRVDILISDLESSTAVRTEASRQLRQLQRRIDEQPAIVQKICAEPLRAVEKVLSGR